MVVDTAVAATAVVAEDGGADGTDPPSILHGFSRCAAFPSTGASCAHSSLARSPARASRQPRQLILHAAATDGKSEASARSVSGCLAYASHS